MMRFLAGDAQIVFEGDLTRCEFPPTIPRVSEDRSILKRQTLTPKLDFLILGLEQDTISAILDTVLPHNRYIEDIIHIQIAKDGNLSFGCYDQFDSECIVCSGVTTEFLDVLLSQGIIKSWVKAPINAIS